MPPAAGRVVTILSVRRHQRQFREPWFRTDVLKRSTFGLTVVYKLLPPHVIASKSIKAFQSLLQKALRKASYLGINNWQRIVAPDHRILGGVAFQRLFDAYCERSLLRCLLHDFWPRHPQLPMALVQPNCTVK